MMLGEMEGLEGGLLRAAAPAGRRSAEEGHRVQAEEAQRLVQLQLAQARKVGAAEQAVSAMLPQPSAFVQGPEVGGSEAAILPAPPAAAGGGDVPLAPLPFRSRQAPSHERAHALSSSPVAAAAAAAGSCSSSGPGPSHVSTQLSTDTRARALAQLRQQAAGPQALVLPLLYPEMQQAPPPAATALQPPAPASSPAADPQLEQLCAMVRYLALPAMRVCVHLLPAVQPSAPGAPMCRARLAHLS